MADDEALVDVVSLKPPSVATIAAAIAVQLAALFTTGVVASYVAALLVVKVGIGSVPLFVGGPLLLAGVFAWILSAPTTSLRYRIAMIVVCGAIALGLLASCELSLVPFSDVHGDLVAIPSIGFIAGAAAVYAAGALAACTLYRSLKHRWENPPPELPRLTLKR